ncbi:hypothetical protein G9A89_002911 [Geosiphon pyriformis]|nr:hypothetical protein G9A89_002911 [Geosiphon pyriformis]
MAQEIKALVLHKEFGEFKLDRIEKPKPKQHELLVKNKAVAINPIDWKQAKYNIAIEGYPIVLGCDVSGIVESVGENVTKFKPGDEVFTFPRLGAQNGYGAFSEYTLFHEGLTFKKPSNITFEEAASFSVGILTAGFVLYDALNLPLPSKQHKFSHPEFILVWGGATSVGAYAIQLAKLSGLTVIATASPRNHEYIRNLGADYLIDYNGHDVIGQINAITNYNLKYVVDTVSSQTANIGLDLLSSGGKLAWIAAAPTSKKDHVEVLRVALGTVYNDPEKFKVITGLKEELQGLIDTGKVKNNIIQIVDGGLEEGILEALKRSEAGVSGKKLVVTIS